MAAVAPPAPIALEEAPPAVDDVEVKLAKKASRLARISVGVLIVGMLINVASGNLGGALVSGGLLAVTVFWGLGGIKKRDPSKLTWHARLHMCYGCCAIAMVPLVLAGISALHCACSEECRDAYLPDPMDFPLAGNSTGLDDAAMGDRASPIEGNTIALPTDGEVTVPAADETTTDKDTTHECTAANGKGCDKGSRRLSRTHRRMRRRMKAERMHRRRAANAHKHGHGGWLMHKALAFLKGGHRHPSHEDRKHEDPAPPSTSNRNLQNLLGASIPAEETDPVTPSTGAEETDPVTPSTGAEETEPVTPSTAAEETEPVTPSTGAEETDPVTPSTAAEETDPVTPPKSGKHHSWAWHGHGHKDKHHKSGHKDKQTQAGHKDKDTRFRGNVQGWMHSGGDDADFDDDDSEFEGIQTREQAIEMRNKIETHLDEEVCNNDEVMGAVSGGGGFIVILMLIGGFIHCKTGRTALRLARHIKGETVPGTGPRRTFAQIGTPATGLSRATLSAGAATTAKMDVYPLATTIVAPPADAAASLPWRQALSARISAAVARGRGYASVTTADYDTQAPRVSPVGTGGALALPESGDPTTEAASATAAAASDRVMSYEEYLRFVATQQGATVPSKH